MLLDDFATSLWPHLPITPKTRSNYIGAYRNHLQPTFGRTRLDEIHRQELQQVLTPLPPPTRHQVLMTARVLFREAIEQGLLEHSPATHIRAPRHTPEKQPFLTWEQVKAADFGKQTNRIRFLAAHGLRWGEAVALTQDDIRDGLVHITKSVHGPTKSKAGVRTVPYLGYFEPFSKARRPLYNALAPYGVTVHSLRKTYAYSLKLAGVHVTTAQKLLGHSSPMVTLAIYTAVLDEEIHAAGETLRQLLGVA